MMDHANGWMNGWMGGGWMWMWPVVGILALVALVVVLKNQSKSKT